MMKMMVDLPDVNGYFDYGQQNLMILKIVVVTEVLVVDDYDYDYGDYYYNGDDDDELLSLLLQLLLQDQLYYDYLVQLVDSLDSHGMMRQKLLELS